MTDVVQVDQPIINLTIIPQVTEILIAGSTAPTISVAVPAMNVAIVDQVTQLTFSQLGAQGPQGVAGPSQVIFYTHNQGVPSAVWRVVHNLNGYPSFTILDSASNQVEGDVVFNDLNTLTLTFSAAFGGVAYLV